MLKVENLSCGYTNKMVIKDLSFNVEPGQVMCLLGPNGSGKTTLFKSILGFLPSEKGRILVDGKDIKHLSRKEVARAVGYVPQSHVSPFPFEALDVVLMGRTAHLGSFQSPNKEDVKIAEEAFEILDISYLKDKIYTQMSGGERQLILIARALVSRPKILIMDEPTSSLDFGNQVMVLKHIQKLSKLGMSIIMSSHFPEHAFLYSQKALLLEKGRVYSLGIPEDVVTEKSLQDLYGVEVDIMSTTTRGGNNIKVCVPSSGEMLAGVLENIV